MKDAYTHEEIVAAVNKCKENEKSRRDEFVALNPTHKSSRVRDSLIYTSALNDLMYELFK